ncbi:MAG: DUF2726 domain-containing protein [Treponema sp.]|nr:DUF2726 domain-containing protein [Treponema sp.]
MNSICKDIFRSLHEGKWLYIEYCNSDNERTKYWIAVQNINIEKRGLEVLGLHLGSFSTKNLTILIDKIQSSCVMEGTYYKTNKNLIEDIDLYPQKYSSIFSEIVNFKILNYLADCNKLADLPKLNTEYPLVSRLDSSKIINRKYHLDDEQFKMIVNSFKKSELAKKDKNAASAVNLALNVLSIYTPKGLYVLAYREVRLEVEQKTLTAGSLIKICTEFCVDANSERKTKLSIHSFLDSEDFALLDDFEKNSEKIKDAITENIRSRTAFAVDDRPYFLCIQRDMNVNLEKEYEAIVDMYSKNEVSVPIRAFFGELHSTNINEEILPIALVDKNVNLDQLLAIHNAINQSVAYIQGPPGTGKTTTILNTIITAFFNSRTVLFSSFNNHPIDGVFEKLANLRYKNYKIPFPVLRIGNNSVIPKTCAYIRNLMISVQNLNAYERVLEQNKQSQIERTRRLSELLMKHEMQIDLEERAELIETLLSKTDNISLQLDLDGQQKTEIKKQLSEIGTITDDDALQLLDFDQEKMLQFLNFTSVKYLKKLYDDEYSDFVDIINITNECEQIVAFNKFFSIAENVERIKNVFPVFCTTCISAQKIGPAKLYFDMTIIDEASQCNTAVSLVPIIRGRRLMLVGDPNQLNPVITLDKNINDELKSKYGVSENYDYITNSIYKVFLANDSVSQETLLHNHYRCAREIINFNNRKYYNNQLKIKTRTMCDKPLLFCDIENDCTTEKNTAPNEADKIIEYVIEHPNEKIGIITPFKNQKELIEFKLKENNLEKNVSCGTVHAFQGDEKDEILFSLALTDKTQQKTYDWLKNNRELLNVATSRAKNRLVVISSTKEMSRLHKEEDDDLYELAQYVRKNGEYNVTSRESSSRALGIKPYSTVAENTFLTTLNHALSTLLDDGRKYSVKREVQLSHIFEKNSSDCDFFYRGSLDFVIFRKEFRNKEIPVLAIELDGPEHKNCRKVMERDEKKKEICKNHGFELIHVENAYARRYNMLKEILEEFFGKSGRRF